MDIIHSLGSYDLFDTAVIGDKCVYFRNSKPKCTRKSYLTLSVVGNGSSFVHLN